MRFLILVLVLALPVVASAKPPTHVEQSDLDAFERARLRFENAQLRIELAKREAEKAKAEYDVLVASTRKKYALNQTDEIDLATREIKREAAKK